MTKIDTTFHILVAVVLTTWFAVAAVSTPLFFNGLFAGFIAGVPFGIAAAFLRHGGHE
jgi:hypothetical protein